MVGSVGSQDKSSYYKGKDGLFYDSASSKMKLKHKASHKKV